MTNRRMESALIFIESLWELFLYEFIKVSYGELKAKRILTMLIGYWCE